MWTQFQQLILAQHTLSYKIIFANFSANLSHKLAAQANQYKPVLCCHLQFELQNQQSLQCVHKVPHTPWVSYCKSLFVCLNWAFIALFLGAWAFAYKSPANVAIHCRLMLLLQLRSLPMIRPSFRNTQKTLDWCPPRAATMNVVVRHKRTSQWDSLESGRDRWPKFLLNSRYINS